MSMNDDIKKYDCYLLTLQMDIIPAPWIKSTDDYNHYSYQLNHFVRQSVRKNSPEFYARVEYLQKLILMPSQMNYDLETVGAESFKKKYGIDKKDLVFDRKEWRSGYYDK